MKSIYIATPAELYSSDTDSSAAQRRIRERLTSRYGARRVVDGGNIRLDRIKVAVRRCAALRWFCTLTQDGLMRACQKEGPGSTIQLILCDLPSRRLCDAASQSCLYSSLERPCRLPTAYLKVSVRWFSNATGRLQSRGGRNP